MSLIDILFNFKATDGAPVLFSKPLFNTQSMKLVEASEGQNLVIVLVLSHADRALNFALARLRLGFWLPIVIKFLKSRPRQLSH